MPKQQKNLLPIDYTHREFETIREDLLGIAERFYPETFQDFSEASFGALTIDAVAYVADQLSFYLDYNVNEAFLDTAYQFANVVRHGNALGYKYTGRPSTYGTVSIFILVPSSNTGLGPAEEYIPILKRGTSFSTNTGLNFVLTENVDFANPKNTVVVAKVNSSTGSPTHYAIKATGTVVSGRFGQERITVGAYERFYRTTLSAQNISEIISVFDEQGNEYYEVDYLAQDMVFKEITNSNFKNDNVPSIIKPFLVSRKFITEFNRNSVTLQFGSGKENSSDVVVNPQNYAVDTFGKKYVSSTSFDPSRLSQNETFGIVPANTKLTVTYRQTNPSNSNVSVGSVNAISNIFLEFKDRQNLATANINEVRNSIEVNNEEPISGEVSFPSTGEIKARIYDTFPTQNRAVTQADYENLGYRMPAKFGTIKRCSVQKDPDSQKRNLNFYILSEDTEGKLMVSNSTIKNNLKTWLNKFRMINDTVDVLDPYIVNFGVEFVVTPAEAADKYKVLDNSVAKLKEHYKETFFIGEPLYISDIYKALKDVDGVLDVVKVKINNKTGGKYSDASMLINQNLSPDGSYLIVPKNAVLELKYPEIDLVGKVR
jgi:uncharacterized phage protein gp47/JayE